MQGLKRQWYINNWSNNLKKQIKNIDSLIESWCKKKLVFARPLLPFGTNQNLQKSATDRRELTNTFGI